MSEDAATVSTSAIVMPITTLPKESVIVDVAIRSLKERGGSSLLSIHERMLSYVVPTWADMDRLTPFIKMYLKRNVASGALTQTKGKRTSGSFKLNASEQKTKENGKAKKPKNESFSAVKKAKTAVKSKSAKSKKPATIKSAAKSKFPAKKTSKVTKPKSPKVKKMQTHEKAAPKKARK